MQTVDLAIRVGWPRDSSHIGRRLGTMEQHLVCSADLAKDVARMREPEDLSELPFIANLALPEPNLWRFSHPTLGRRSIRVHPKISVDATTAALAAVLGGAGLAVLPDYSTEPELAAGRLLRVLPAWKLRSGGIHALLPSARFRAAKVSRFLEAMSQAEANRRRPG